MVIVASDHTKTYHSQQDSMDEVWPIAEKSDNTHKTLTRDSHTPGGIRKRDTGNRATALKFKEL